MRVTFFFGFLGKKKRLFSKRNAADSVFQTVFFHHLPFVFAGSHLLLWKITNFTQLNPSPCVRIHISSMVFEPQTFGFWKNADELSRLLLLLIPLRFCFWRIDEIAEFICRWLGISKVLWILTSLDNYIDVVFKIPVSLNWELSSVEIADKTNRFVQKPQNEIPFPKQEKFFQVTHYSLESRMGKALIIWQM